MKRFIFPAAFGLAGFAAGWLLSPRAEEAPAAGGGSGGGRVATGPGGAPVLRGSAGGGEPGPVVKDLEAAFLAGGSGYPAMRPLMRALDAMSPANVSEFNRFFSLEPLRKEQIPLWRMFVSAWAQFDSQGAIAFIDGRFREPAARRMFYAAVLDNWSSGSVADALEFAVGHSAAGTGEGGADLVLDFLKSVAEEDPERALAMAGRLGDAEFVMDLVSQRVVQLAKEDRGLALRAIAELEGEMHDHAAGRFMVEWARQEPAAAAEWLSSNYTEGLGNFTIGEVAAAYIQRDPAAALGWIGTLPEGVPRGEVLAAAVGGWIQSDAASAIEWLRELEVDPLYDPAVASVGNHLSSENPQEVIEEWVPKISDTSAASELLYEVSLGWQRDDPGGYSSWLETTQAISDFTRQRLLAREIPAADAPGPAAPTSLPKELLDQGRRDGDGGF